jgi:hypothetical protein
MTQEQREEYEKMHNASIHQRGVMIENLTYLERCIEESISSHFCRDNPKLRGQLMEYIICPNRLNFKHKKDILKGIIENKENPYGDISKKYPKLFDHIDKIAVHRNIFAHNILDTSVEALARFKKNKELKFITITVCRQNKVNYCLDSIS